MQTPGTEIPFTNGFYRSGRSLPYSAQRCVGWRPNFSKKPALSNSNLYQVEGVRAIIDDLDGINRGACEFDNEFYCVNGEKLYKITQTINPDKTEVYAAVLLATLPNNGGTGRVIMVPGQLDIVIVVPGQYSYSWNDGTSTLTELDPLPNFRTAQDCVHINSLFVFLESDSNIIFHSELNDPTTYGVTNFTTTYQISSGVGLIKFRNQLYVCGDSQTIPYVYTGGVISGTILTFAFTPQPNAELDIGLRSTFGKVAVKDGVVILGAYENEAVGVYLFPNKLKVSTETVDYVIQNLTDDEISNAFMLKLSQNDANNIYVMAGDESMVYDIVTNTWHEDRTRYNETSIRKRYNSITQVYNRFLVGDSIDGRIGIIDDQINTEYGVPMYREVVFQPIEAKGKMFNVSELLVWMDVGYGGDDITLYISTEGGLPGTFGNGITASPGEPGEYGRLVSFDRLGSTPSTMVFKLVTNSTEKCNINKVLAR